VGPGRMATGDYLVVGCDRDSATASVHFMLKIYSYIMSISGTVTNQVSIRARQGPKKRVFAAQLNYSVYPLVCVWCERATYKYKWSGYVVVYRLTPVVKACRFHAVDLRFSFSQLPPLENLKKKCRQHSGLFGN
jgi:hypothetical protein